MLQRRPGLLERIIADEHVLMLDAGAPSGTYGLYIGLYDARDGLRLRSTWGMSGSGGPCTSHHG